MAIDKRLVALYARKSRLKNDDEMEIARQIELLVDYAEAHNMDYKIFPEEGSSEDWNRPELQRMLLELSDGIYDGVLVTEQDRISRDSTDIGLFKRICIKEGLLFHTLDKTYNFANDDDNFITGIQAEVDNQFMRIMKRKMMRGRIQALESGIYFGIPPFGYSKSPTKPKILIKHPKESKAIELIFDSYVNKGMNQVEVAEAVNLLGYKTKENKPFSSKSIAAILSNMAYIGTLYYELKSRTIITEHAHEAIINKQLFNQAQIIRSERRAVPQKSKRGAYLLSRLIKCRYCKTTLSFCAKSVNSSGMKNRDKNNRESFVLDCHASLSTVRKSKEDYVRCTNMGVKAVRIEEYVFQNLRGRLGELDDEIELIMQEGNNMFKGVQGQIEQIDISIAGLSNRRKKVQEGYEAGIYTIEESKVKLKEIEDDGMKLENKKEKLSKLDMSSEINRKQETKEKIETLLSSESLSVVDSNSLLREIIDCIFYYKDKPDNKKLHPMYLSVVYK